MNGTSVPNLHIVQSQEWLNVVRHADRAFDLFVPHAHDWKIAVHRLAMVITAPIEAIT